MTPIGMSPRTMPFNGFGAGYNYTLVNGTNVFGYLSNSPVPKDIYLIVAHYDTVYGSPGVFDNAAGVCVLLQVARQISMFKKTTTTDFLFLLADREESLGLLR
jgi:Zn-dependent M28 family amino/carboxypeptidase